MNPFYEEEQANKRVIASMGIKIGSRITITHLKGEESHAYDGRTGTVNHIDDHGQVFGDWGGCAIIPSEDDFQVL